MSFSYHNCDGTNDTIDIVRALISDTQSTTAVWSDEEIGGFYRAQAMTFQSGQFYSGTGGSNLPSSPVSVLRVAALMLDAMASNEAKLSQVTELLDGRANRATTAKALHQQAVNYRQIEDDSGAFAIIEQCHTQFGYLDRFWKQVQRQSAQ